MGELKACPFCGSEAHKYLHRDGKPGTRDSVSWWEVACNGSGGHHALFTDWNNRPIESALQARIAELTIPAEVEDVVRRALDYYANCMINYCEPREAESAQHALDWFTAARKEQG